MIRRRALVLTVLAAAGVAVVALVAGVDTLHAVGLGAVVPAIVLLGRLVPADEQAGVPPEAPSGDGGRSDVDRLAWGLLEHRTRVRTAVLRRVAAIAAARLAPRGLVLTRAGDAARIEALLGTGSVAVLTADPAPAVPLDALEALLTRLEALDPDRSAP